MKITLDKEMLQRRLRVMERIIPKRGGLPFYYVVNIDASVEGFVSLSAGNGKEFYATMLSTTDEDFEDGSVAVPAQELIRAVATAPGDTVVISSDEGTVTRIESRTARWNIDSLAGVTPSSWESWNESFEHQTNKTELIRVLEATRYAAAKTETWPAFMQVHVGEGRVVAADGRRVHQEALGPAGSMPTFNIPERAVDTLLEALNAEESTGQVGVSVGDDGEMTFAFGTMQYLVGRLQYDFPDIDSLVLDRARDQQGRVVCSRDQLVTAIKVAQVTIEEGGYVALEFTNGVIQVSGSSQRGDGIMDVRCSNDPVPSGTALRVNAADLLEMLGKAPTDHEEDGDVVFTIANEGSDPGWVYIASGSMEAAVRPVLA